MKYKNGISLITKNEWGIVDSGVNRQVVINPITIDMPNGEHIFFRPHVRPQSSQYPHRRTKKTCLPQLSSRRTDIH